MFKNVLGELGDLSFGMFELGNMRFEMLKTSWVS